MGHVFEVSYDEYEAIARAARERGPDAAAFFHAWVESVQAYVADGTRDPDQAWFWTPEWQAKEREVDEAIARGEHGTIYETEEELLRGLDALE